MSKRTLLLSFFVTFVFAGCKQTVDTTAQVQVEQTDTVQEAKKMAAALAGGNSVHCTMEKPGSTEKIETWLKEKKIRMHSSGIQGQAAASTVLNDGTALYIWEDGKTEGVKFTISADTQAQAQQFTQDIPDLSDESIRKSYEDQGYTLICTEEPVAETEFVPPTSVTFVDTSAQIDGAMKAIQGQMEDMPAEQKEQMNQLIEQIQRR